MNPIAQRKRRWNDFYDWNTGDETRVLYRSRKSPKARSPQKKKTVAYTEWQRFSYEKIY